MIKILLITENSPYAIGGIERHCRKIMDMYKDNSSVEIDFLCKENIKYKWNKWLNKFVFDYKYLISEIEKSNYDIIHVHGFASMVAYQGLRAAFQLKKKTIYTAHYHPFTSLRRPVFGRLFFHFYIHLIYSDNIQVEYSSHYLQNLWLFLHYDLSCYQTHLHLPSS